MRLLLLALLATPAAGQIVFAPPHSHAVTHPLLASLAGDVDFDGDADVVAEGAFPGAFIPSAMTVFLSLGGGELGSPVPYLLSLSSVGEGQIADVADWDGPTTSLPDGLPDIVLGGVGHGNNIGVGWKAGHGDGSFGQQASGLDGFNINNTSITDVIVIDLEGDGDSDYLALEGGIFPFIPARVVTGTQSAPGGFAFGWSAPAPAAAVYLAGHDIDGDGRVDAVCNSSSGGTLSIFKGNPAGGMQAPSNIPVGGSPRELAFTDLDENGAADLLVCNPLLDAVQVILDSGIGLVGTATACPAGIQPFRLAVGDLDGDSHTDVLASAANGEVIVLQGAGDGTLTRIATVSSPLGALGLALGDLDVDGDLDATVARAGSPGTLDVLLNATYPDASPFTDLGHSLPGTKGHPIQIAEGTLNPGETFGFHLWNAKPSTTATHVVGLSALFAPYKGGTLVPAPDLLNPLVTDAAGELHLVGPWPAGGSGLTLWLQFWIADPAGPKGRAASNAVAATIP